ncbi:MlaD family protein [Amycolatopsis sp.]|uniref:MlaD family protein n=1 Tax=Amycolatopsis sp. TaxID=37632 RepID=UPI002C65F0D8|nr:MlaD family protein [Amycolatopsis sp.]HVV12665.1 MlaD family protein [Amycolatopsis sp.]
MIRTQLTVFVLVTIVSLVLVGVYYVRLPEQFGAGEYHVSLNLPDAAGLYPNAIVTYRGVEIGRVRGVRAVRSGADIDLAIEDGNPVPADVVPEVHSTSAVGEQYVNLVPASPLPGGPVLADGAKIDGTQARLPVATLNLLDDVDRFAKSVPAQSLNVTVDELYKAFNGSGEDLTRLLDTAMQFQDKADANLKPTLDLISHLVPVLGTQQQLAPQIQSYSRDLRSFTSQLAASDGTIRRLIADGAPAADQLDGLFGDLRPTLPVLLADLATVGRVTTAYLPGIEHVLTVLPATILEMQSAGGDPRHPDIEGGIDSAKLDFKLNVNDPPTCTAGFENAGKHRDPNDLSPAPIPQDSYCKVPQNDPRVVRGARNDPCPNNPAKRAATAAGCGLIFDRVTVPGAAPQPVAVTYDPDTGDVQAPDGKLYQLADLARNGPLPHTWQDLIRQTLAP